MTKKQEELQNPKKGAPKKKESTDSRKLISEMKKLNAETTALQKKKEKVETTRQASPSCAASIQDEPGSSGQSQVNLDVMVVLD